MADLIKKSKDLQRVFNDVHEKRSELRKNAVQAFIGRMGGDLSRMATPIAELEKALTRQSPLQGWVIEVDSPYRKDNLRMDIDPNHQIFVYADGTLVIQYPIQQNYQPYGGIGLTEEDVATIECAAVEWLKKHLFRNVILSMRSVSHGFIYIDDNNKAVGGMEAVTACRHLTLVQP